MIWFANLAIFAVENPLIWTDAVFSVVLPTLVAQRLFFFFLFLKHEEIHEPLPFLKNKPLTFKCSASPTMMDNLFPLKAKLTPTLMPLQGQRGRTTGTRITHTVVQRSSLQSTSSPSWCGLTQLYDPLMFETTTWHQMSSSHLEIMDILVSVCFFCQSNRKKVVNLFIRKDPYTVNTEQSVSPVHLIPMLTKRK